MPQIVIVGNGAVGKSSMIQRYCKGLFTSDYKMTIGVDFLERVVRYVAHDAVAVCPLPLPLSLSTLRSYDSVNGARVHLMLWDTAGQEEFDALTKAYYRVSDGCVLAFSTTDVKSFDAVEKWKKKVEFECGPIPMVLVQNKCDLMDQCCVPSDCVERLAKSLNMPLFLASSKNNVNIDKGELMLFDPPIRDDAGLSFDVASFIATCCSSAVFYTLAKTCVDLAATPESGTFEDLGSVASVRRSGE